MNQLCHSEALVEGLRWAARAHDDVLGVDNSTTPPKFKNRKCSWPDYLRENHDICANSLGPLLIVGDMCGDGPLWRTGTIVCICLHSCLYAWLAGSLEVAWFSMSDVWRVCPFGPPKNWLRLLAKKEREKCRFLKISPIENMSRCRDVECGDLGI